MILTSGLAAATVLSALAPVMSPEQARDQKPVCKVPEATRNFDPATSRTTYLAKVEYAPSAGKTVKSITIVLYENLGPDGMGGFKRGQEKDRKKFEPPKVNANGSTDWLRFDQDESNDYLVGAELQESDETVTPAKAVKATNVVK
jgi:hypothetical protein